MPKVSMLAEKVRLISVPSDKFKTGIISVSMALPLDERAAANALMLFLLKRSCKEYPDFSMLNGKLDELYGASVSAGIFKKGDAQVLTMNISSLDDRFALTDESIAEQSAELLAGMIFKPNCKSGSFGAENLALEKRLLIQQVEEEFNNKRTYSFNKCIGHMCQNEPFGRGKYGTVEEINAVKMVDVYAAWKNMLSSAVFQITVVGSVQTEKVEKIFTSYFKKIYRTPENLETKFILKGGRFNRFEERQPVNQGKLVIGMRAGMSSSRDNIHAVTVMNDIFGRGTYSKLFTNVREKLSLAYYCNSRLISDKGIVAVEAGIDTDKEKKVTAEVLTQLTDLRNGKTEPEILEASKLSLKERHTFSTPEEIAAWYGSQIAEEEIFTPEQEVEGIEAVTMEQVCEAAKKLTIDTIFMLAAQPEEDAENED